MTDEIKENRRKSQEKIDRKEYDVLLSYNSKDREHVTTIGNWLKDNGIAPWLDMWDLRPGLPWMPLLEEQIEQTKAAAIFVGDAGFGPWHEMERQMLLNQLVSRTCPVIPVILEGALGKIKFPGFLAGNTWVDFRQKDPDPLEHLIQGIIGKRPAKVYRPGVLIASLGDSPVVVPAMYDLLTKNEKLTLDRVIVLHPNGEDIQDSYKLVRETFGGEISLVSEQLDFEDANSWWASSVFLQRLYKLLREHQERGDSVYLSLAGGRKSMAALMAWVVPFFSCVKKLYHVIDKDEKYFQPLNNIVVMSSTSRVQAMRPSIKDLLLVEIPCERGQEINQALLKKILESVPDDFEKAEALITGRTIVQDSAIPKLTATRPVIEHFQRLSWQDVALAREVHKELLKMHQMITEQKYDMNVETYSYKAPKSSRIMLHSLVDLPSHVRSVYYTLPNNPDDPVEQIVICSLETAAPNGSRTLKEIASSSGFSLKPYGELPAPASPAESVLIVPLGDSPMVATQLYTLLKEREQHTIHEVVLIYPQLSAEIENAAQIVRDALRAESGVLCTLAAMPDLVDIAHKKDCEKYQTYLEDEIVRVQQTYPGCKIDLALSGGRKGMTAMTIFAAQRKHISYAYHTLITDDSLDEEIQKQTTVTNLNRTSLSRQERDDLLFLRTPKYREGEAYPYEQFGLFRVPIFSEGW